MKVSLNKTPELTTKCICHKGFIWHSSVVARLNFRIGGQAAAPQSLTAHTRNRYTNLALNHHPLGFKK